MKQVVMEGCRCTRHILQVVGRSTILYKCYHMSGRRLLVDALAVSKVRQIPRAFSSSTVTGFAQVIGFGRLSPYCIEQTFVRGQRTKAQPVNNQKHGNEILSTERSKVVDPDVSLYHRPTQHSININLQQRASQEDAVVQLSSAQAQNVQAVNLQIPDHLVNNKFESPEKLKDALRAVHRHHSAAVQDDKSSANLSSIEELMCREIKPNLELSQLPGAYARLSKLRLTGLVVVTSIAGYAMAPGAFDASTLILCGLGTALTSASANAINQFLEVPYDAQMNRTKTRPVVKGQISPLHAVSFAIVCGTVGSAVLFVGVNPLTAALGVFNLALYTMVYTPMKRLSIANTWVGSIVGAIPPLMGWAASTGTLQSGGFLLAAVMFAWQFPHFCALSWNLQPDYSRAGYRMMSVIAPALCKRTSLRYSVALSAICLSAPYFDLTTWTFAADSLPLNAYLMYLAWKFYRDGDSNSSRRLFHFTLVHLPALLVLMLISKKHYGKEQIPAAAAEALV